MQLRPKVTTTTEREAKVTWAFLLLFKAWGETGKRWTLVLSNMRADHQKRKSTATPSALWPNLSPEGHFSAGARPALKHRREREARSDQEIQKQGNLLSLQWPAVRKLTGQSHDWMYQLCLLHRAPTAKAPQRSQSWDPLPVLYLVERFSAISTISISEDASLFSY